MREPYLDGLRGWAAVFVVLFHAGPEFFGRFHTIGGVRPFFIDGALAVSVFFVLSAYVLSVDFFRTGDRRRVVDLALRRYIRLTVPALASVLFACAIMQAGGMFNGEAGRQLGNGWLGQFYQFYGSFVDAAWYGTIGIYTTSPADIRSSYSSYNAVLWTMYYEFLGSLALFAVLLAVGKAPRLRLAAHGVCIGATWWARSPLLAFALGAALAHLSTTKLHLRIVDAKWANAAGRYLCLVALCFAALRWDRAPVVLMALCSAGIVYSVLVSPWLRVVLSKRVSRSLGKYSFPLYLVHLPLLCSVTSFAYLFIVRHGLDGTGMRLLLITSSLVVYGAAAWAFRPVEVTAINLSRAFGRWAGSTANCRDRATSATRPVPL